MAESNEPNWEQYAPDVDPPWGTGSDFSVEAAREALAQFGIINAYRRWCGKSEPDPGSRTESIMVSCPRPDHPDTNPSAWLNSERNLWFCGGCQEGGDIVDIGAYRYGYAVPDYKTDARFIQLITTMLEDIGVNIEGLSRDWVRTAEEVTGERVGEADLTVPPINPFESEDPAAEDNPDRLPKLDWRPITPGGTFMDDWMQRMCRTRIPDEYLYFLGLLMVGLAVGRQRSLRGAEFPVHPNLMVMLVGQTGAGKSIGVGKVTDLLREALPWDPEDPTNKGVALFGRPGSGEALLDGFAWRPQGSAKFLSVRGLVDIDELSGFMHAAKRKGSTLKEFVISLYDGRTVAHHTKGNGKLEAVDPFMAAIGGIQPDALVRALEEEDVAGGFANRFCFVHGTRKPRQRWGAAPEVDLTGLAVELQAISNWAGSSNAPFMLTADAVDEWEALGAHLEHALIYGDLYARLELQAMKLLMIVGANERANVLTLDHVQRVVTLMEYLLPSAHEVNAKVGVTEINYIYNRIMTVLDNWPAKHDGKYPSFADILSRFSLSRQRKQLDLISEVLHRMERQGRVATMLDPKTGTRRYRRNDR